MSVSRCECDCGWEYGFFLSMKTRECPRGTPLVLEKGNWGIFFRRGGAGGG